MAASRVEPDLTTSELIEVRRSDVHGLGVFAAKQIPKGARIIEYVGERVSHDEADRRYEEKDANDSHTFLFIVDSKTVIDAGVDGNDARFFNHSCDPNCESTVEKKRVYIEAIRDIEPGTELTYDYQIHREDDDPDNIDEVFACRCGFPNCRGTMLWPTEREPKRKKSRSKAKAQSRGKTRSGGGSATTSGASSRRKSTARGKTAAKRAKKTVPASKRRGKTPGRRTTGKSAKKSGGRSAAKKGRRSGRRG
jgi:uncharacterized protein